MPFWTLDKKNNIKTEKMELIKSKHAAGGFIFSTTTGKGNTKFGEAKKEAIVKAIQDSWSEGVYQTTDGKVKKQLLNGSSEFLSKDTETGKFQFTSY